MISLIKVMKSASKTEAADDWLIVLKTEIPPRLDGPISGIHSCSKAGLVPQVLIAVPSGKNSP